MACEGVWVAARIKLCCTPSLFVETEREDAVDTQCQDGDHQAAPSRQDGSCCRECQP